jgi:hypothetical protein
LENFTAMTVLETKLPALSKANEILKTCALSITGLHVAFAGLVTVHAGLLPMVGDPESVMRMPEAAVDAMPVLMVKVTVAVVVAPLI